MATQPGGRKRNAQRGAWQIRQNRHNEPNRRPYDDDCFLPDDLLRGQGRMHLPMATIPLAARSYARATAAKEIGKRSGARDNPIKESEADYTNFTLSAIAKAFPNIFRQDTLAQHLTFPPWEAL